MGGGTTILLFFVFIIAAIVFLLVFAVCSVYKGVSEASDTVEGWFTCGNCGS